MKQIATTAAYLLTALIVQAHLVDDFESYQTGGIGTVTTAWVGSSDGGVNPSTASIITDTIDLRNKAIQLTEGGGTGQQWVRCALSAPAQIAQAGTGTLFVRFRAAAASDISFGLTDLDTASNDWNHFRVQIAVINGTIRARDGGSTRILAWKRNGTQVALNTDWYYLWVVVDNNADNIRVYLNQTGADATENDRLVRSDLLTQETFAFRSAADTLDQFFWRAQNGAVSRLLVLDDIHIRQGADLTVPAMNKPYSPAVAQTQDNANNDVDVVLSWKAAADPTGVNAVNPDIVDQYVFMSIGADPNMYYRGATGIDPGLTNPDSGFALNVAPGQPCKWVVVEAMSGHKQVFTPNVSQITAVDPNNIVGPTWSFTSILLVPDFTGNPSDQWVFPGETAVFSVALRNAAGVTYQWYKGTQALSDGGTVSGSATATLTIADAQLADEGTYFCRATNSAGTSDSAGAVLRIKRLVSHYPLETDTRDSISGYDMILMQEGAAGLPTLTAGAVSPAVGTYSLLFDNGDHATNPDGQYVQIGAGVVNYPDISITAWVYWKGGANWQRIFDFGNDTSHYMFLTPSNGSECRFVLNNGSGEQIAATSPLPTHQWVFVAVTLEGTTGRIYINGEPKATNTGMTINPTDIAPTLNYIGKSQFSADAELDGMIDDVRIYNYGLSAETIGGQYYGVTGIRPCIDPAFAGSIYNRDNTGSSYCKVDLADFALLAANWLADGLWVAP